MGVRNRLPCERIFITAMSFIALDLLKNLTSVWKFLLQLNSLLYLVLNNLKRLTFVTCLYIKDLLPYCPKEDFCIFG